MRALPKPKAGIGAWLNFYNNERQHQGFDYPTPRQIYEKDLWMWTTSVADQLRPAWVSPYGRPAQLALSSTQRSNTGKAARF